MAAENGITSNSNNNEKRAPRWRRRKEARPAEILAAALEIFGERGYEATRLVDVARRAGCTKGTIFLYYENKIELFKAAVREVMMPLMLETERLVEQESSSSLELVEQLLRLRWDHMMRNRLSGLVKLMLAETRTYPELARFYNDEFIERNQALLQSVLTRGIERGELRKMDVTQVARFLVAPMMFATVWRHSFEHAVGTPGTLDDYFESSLTIMLAGLVPGHVPTHA